MSTINRLSTLPEELQLTIFSYLDLPTLGKCCSVSTDWRRLASDNQLWEKLCQRMFPGVQIPATEIKNHLKFLKSQCITSLDEIIERVKIFADKLSENRAGLFNCQFPLNPECSLTFYFREKDTEHVLAIGLKEFVIFTKNVNVPPATKIRNSTHYLGDRVIRIEAKNIPDNTILDFKFKLFAERERALEPRAQKNYGLMAIMGVALAVLAYAVLK